MGDRIHAPVALPLVKESPEFAHCIRGWVMPTACLEVRANPLSHQNQTSVIDPVISSILQMC